jgi:hypothetical protein
MTTSYRRVRNSDIPVRTKSLKARRMEADISRTGARARWATTLSDAKAAAMSDELRGPVWSLADDSAQHRPDAATTTGQEGPPRATPIPVPELALTEAGELPTLPFTPQRPTWSGESDRRPEAGPMYPDLFQQAVAGSALANAVTVNYADGQQHETFDALSTTSPIDDSQLVGSSSVHLPAEVGAFIGASARKRWRRSH